MKKVKPFIALAIVLFFVISSFNSYSADPKRMILVEEATNTSCGPCAAQNPSFKLWLQRNMDNVIPLIYHAWWPGNNDPMYLNDVTMNTERIKFYGFEKIGVPCAAVNGKIYPKGISYDGAPGDTASLTKEASKYFGKTSPYNITIKETKNGSTVNVDVTVKSIENIDNKKLRVAVVEYYHNYSGMPNGESEFFYVARKMLPDYKGTLINHAPGTEKTYSFSYSPKSDWNADGLYIVAFLQDDNTKEVLQAATSMNIKTASAEFATIQNNFLAVEPSKTTTKKITLKNPNNFACNFEVSIDQANSSIPSSWQVSLNPMIVEALEPGATQDITVTIKTSSNSGSAIMNFIAEPKADGVQATFPAKTFYFALSTNTKYAYFYGTNGGNQMVMSSALSFNDYTADKYALIPFNISAFQTYSSFDFDGIFFSFNYDTRGILGGDANYSAYSNELFKMINKALANNKKVFITSELDFIYANQAGSQQAKDFYNKTLGLTHSSTKQLISSDGTQLYAFKISGIKGDPVSDGFAVDNMNGGYNAGWPYATLFSDAFTINNGSKSKPMFLHDNDPTKVAGIRYEDGKAKLVYLAFGLEAIPTTWQRAEIANKILDYLFGESSTGSPAIASDVSIYSFGNVKVGQTKTKDITLTNTGTGPLTINEITTDDEDGVFLIKNGPSTNPIVVQPQGTHKFTVEFTPKAKKDYSIFLSVLSNAKNSSELVLSIDGTGIEEISNVNDYISSDNNLEISVSPNVISNSGNVDVKLKEFNSAELKLFDSNGNLVKILSNDLIEGNNNLQLNADDLVNGKYYLVIKSGKSAAKAPVLIVK